MRLIDADALGDKVADLYSEGEEATEGDKVVNDVIDLIDNAPTIEAERPQGEWLTHRVAFHLTCPFCGCNLRALKDKVFEGDYEYNFCPNCGAKMTKGAENEQTTN